MTPVDVLRAAREKVLDRWGRGTTYHESRDVCALQAIALSADSSEASWRAGQLLRDVIGENIMKWNDAPGRTKEQVLAAFDRAITTGEGNA